MPFPNWTGKTRYWTKERVVSALRKAAQEIKGPLPCGDRAYNRIKKGRLDWPTYHRVLEFFDTLARAWLAVGAPIRRVSLKNNAWTREEEAYLLDNAGGVKLTSIARILGRSQPAVRKRLQAFQTRARDMEGFLSAAQVAREYRTSYTRVCTLLNTGRIPGAKFDRVRNRWKVDPFSLTSDIEELLTAPRKNHKDWPLDLGDYRARYGIVRHSGHAQKELVPA